MQYSFRIQGGSLPFHLALQSKSDWKDGIDVLFSASPGVTRIRDSNGKLPIQVAIEHGWDWNGEGLNEIFEAFPDAANERDEETGMPMFLLAASTTKPRLSTIYSLVRAKPEVLFPRFESTATESSPPPPKRRKRT